GSPDAASRRASSPGESDEKSPRQRSRRTAAAGRPSTVGERTAEPAPGTVAPSRRTGYAAAAPPTWAYRESGAASSGATSRGLSATVKSRGTWKEAWSAAPRASVARYVAAKR